MLQVFLLTAQQQQEYNVPQLGILDVASSSFDESQRNMFSDVLRTEVFQINYFRIVERGMIQQILQEQQISMSGLTDDSQLLEIGKLISVEKLLVLKIDEFADTLVMNIRVIDVNTSLLDFTQNVFLEDKNQIFNAIKDLVIQLQMFYVEGDLQMDPRDRQEIIRQNWITLGADEQALDFLLEQNIAPADFLEVRQYDITFTVQDYIKMHNDGWDIQTIKTFFKENISYDEIVTALNFGINDVTNYQESFKPWGLTFAEYLDAYANHVVSPEEYEEYKKGYDKDKIILSIGGVANSLPIMNSEFSFLLLNAGWEHYISDYQRNRQKYSTEKGLYLMNGVMPSPYFQMNYYVGAHPFYAKVAVGTVAEIFMGGHVGLFAKAGMELNGTFEFSVMATFLGTQPSISYTDMESRPDEDGYAEILFPYFGAFLTYKL
jgi:hypothetical protein